MKILLAAKYPHYPQGGGGLERNTHELCLRLVRRGVTPAVICDLKQEFSPLVLRNRLARLRAPAVRFPADDALGYSVYRGWSNETGAREVVERFEPDVVIVQSAFPVPLVESFGGLGVPRMAYFHEVARVGDAGVIAAMGDVGLLANSEFTSRKMQAASGIWPPVIRPLIDPTFYRVETQARNVLFVNAKPHKGVEIAFGVAQRRPDVHFDFIRSWDMSASEARALTARARAAGNITLHNPTNDMRSLYGRARLLLAPSQCEEAWGRVVSEAQVSGIPVLASDRGGLPEAVGPGGLVVPHDAPILHWLDAFATLWDSPTEHQRYATAAREYSERAEIQPEEILTKFIGEVSDFSRNRAKVALSAQAKVRGPAEIDPMRGRRAER